MSQQTTEVGMGKEMTEVMVSLGGLEIFELLKPEVMPKVADLVNEMLLRGSSEEEVRATVNAAARSYKSFIKVFIDIGIDPAAALVSEVEE